MTRAGDAMDPGGSAGGFGVYWDVPLHVPGSFSTIAPLPGLYSVGGAMAATGRALDWYRLDVLGGAASTERLIEEAGTIAPGADGVVFLPYLAGERSPLWDPSARGAFVGLALGHGRAHLTRAILEASAFAIRHVAEGIVGTLQRGNVQRSVLMHGFDATVWPFVRLAKERRYSTRVGLEDGKLLPSGMIAANNAELVAAAVEIFRSES